MLQSVGSQGVGHNLTTEQQISYFYHTSAACVCVCVLIQSRPVLCDPMDCSLHCPWRFSRQAYLIGLPCPPPGDLPNPGIELRSPTLQADSLPSELPGKLSAGCRLGQS